MNEIYTVDSLTPSLTVRQYKDAFRFGTDAVLLAWFSCRRVFSRSADLCAGCGVVSLLQYSRRPSASYTAVELDERVAALARESVRDNGLTDKVKVVTGDVKNIASLLSAGAFDLVTANSPYLDLNPGKSPAFAGSARQETDCTVFDVAKAASYLLREGGRFCAVMRADRLTDLLCAMRENRVEPKRLCFVRPTTRKAPYLVLCEGIRGGKPGLTETDTVVLRDEEGNETELLKKIYGNGETE